MSGASSSRRILITGAGIAGLTAAIAFASRGFAVTVLEKAAKLDEIGAGLQLSPNATRILRELGVMDGVLPAAVRPQALQLRDAATLQHLARIPLGDAAERRWNAPYLTVHRADLQSALLARAAREDDLTLVTGAHVRDAAFHGRGVTVSWDRAGRMEETHGRLLVGADGVWSATRGFVRAGSVARFSGYVAWRTTLRRSDKDGLASRLIPVDDVTAFLHPDFHLVAYPIRAGAAVNLVAVTRGAILPETWSTNADPQPLRNALEKAGAPFATLMADAGPWTAWPLHAVDMSAPMTARGLFALIGDAGHAMTPFAAQGAAMAIEDAAVLASLVGRHLDDQAQALARYQALRRPRLARVARRGAFNRFAWHAGGPFAAGRNLVLKFRRPEALMADLDWLYGWRVDEPLTEAF